jgi:hypothetical protein
MPWTTSYNPALGIVETILSGPVTDADLQQATTKTIQSGKNANTTKFLIDTSEMIMAASLVDLLALPTEQYEKEGADRKSRVAVISPKKGNAVEAVQFYETACRNRGWIVMLFAERQSALDWLLSKTGFSSQGTRGY